MNANGNRYIARKGENWVIYSLSKSIVSSTVTKKGYQGRSF